MFKALELRCWSLGQAELWPSWIDSTDNVALHLR